VGKRVETLKSILL